MEYSKLVNLEIRENKAEIEEVARRAGIVLKEKRNILCVLSGEEDYTPLATFAYVFLLEAINYLYTHKEDDVQYDTSDDSDTKVAVKLNVLDLFDIGISYKDSENAEKDGNYTPFATPGKEFIQILESALNDPRKTEDEEV